MYKGVFTSQQAHARVESEPEITKPSTAGQLHSVSSCIAPEAASMHAAATHVVDFAGLALHKGQKSETQCLVCTLGGGQSCGG